MALTKIAAGYYRNDRGTARNVYSHSGAPHTRNTRARWLVEFTDGSASCLVSSLATARALLAGK